MKKVYILDTTLRDGNQAPGAKLDLESKKNIALELEKMGVDYIEAGFPASSKGEFEATNAVARVIKNSTVVAFARAIKSDIKEAYESIKVSNNPMINVVIGTSNNHIRYKFKSIPEKILEMGVEAVEYAKTFTPMVQFTAEDASRSNVEFLIKTIKTVVKAGAKIINIADTVGYSQPDEFGELIKKIYYAINDVNDEIILSVHCHNDMGLATANTLTAIKNGANKIECTLNGLGERAGNAALEEAVIALKVRQNYYSAYTEINTKQINLISKMTTSLMGGNIQANKAIIGDNAFAHSAGIHQDGLIKSRNTYQVINPEDIGIAEMEFALTAHSGRHAIKKAIEDMGFKGQYEEKFELIFNEFVEFAERKKECYHHELFDIVRNICMHRSRNHNVKFYSLVDYRLINNKTSVSANLKILCDGKIYKSKSNQNNMIKAVFECIKRITNIDLELQEFKVNEFLYMNKEIGNIKVQASYRGANYSIRVVEKNITKATIVALINIVNRIKIKHSNWQLAGN